MPQTQILSLEKVKEDKCDRGLQNHELYAEVKREQLSYRDIIFALPTSTSTIRNW